jgi:hypothetical protein
MYVKPPIPTRTYDWSAIDADTYSGEPSDAIGWGVTEQGAVDDLMDKLAQQEVFDDTRAEELARKYAPVDAYESDEGNET